MWVRFLNAVSCGTARLAARYAVAKYHVVPVRGFRNEKLPAITIGIMGLFAGNVQSRVRALSDTTRTQGGTTRWQVVGG